MPVVCTFAKTTALYPKCMACMYMGILTHWSRTKTADILQMFSNASCGVKSFMYVHILFHISLKCVPYGPVNYDKPALVQVMLYHRKGSAGDVDWINFFWQGTIWKYISMFWEPRVRITVFRQKHINKSISGSRKIWPCLGKSST